MDKKIPTTKFVVEFEGVKKEYEIYQWLTQDENYKYSEILLLNYKVDRDGVELYSQSDYNNANKFLIMTLVKDLDWEEFTMMSPKFREPLIAEVKRIFEDSKKK